MQSSLRVASAISRSWLSSRSRTGISTRKRNLISVPFAILTTVADDMAVTVTMQLLITATIQIPIQSPTTLRTRTSKKTPTPSTSPPPSSPAPTRSAYAEIPRTGRRNAHVLTLTLRARESETGWSEGLAQEDDLMDAEAHAAGRVDSVAGAWSLEELHEPKMGAEAGVRDVDFACDEPVETRLLL